MQLPTWIALFLCLLFCFTSVNGVAAESQPDHKEWVGKFADGSPLTRETLDKLLAAHAKWLDNTSSKKLVEEARKLATKKEKEAIETLEEQGIQPLIAQAFYPLYRRLFATDWGGDEGRLVIPGASLDGANLQEAKLRLANLQAANLSNANLQDANLNFAILQEANLSYANLQESVLFQANLQEANLSNANLQGLDSQGAIFQRAYLGAAKLQEAGLSFANLQDAYLSYANLQNADLGQANLQNADLDEANLQEASLNFANLQEANLSSANLQNADLSGADLTFAHYEPKPDAIPNIPSLRSAVGLDKMLYRKAPHGLQDLRKKFKENHYTLQERQITHAIKRSEWENAKREGRWIEAWFNRILFDWPVAYGLYPDRALKILSWLIGFFSLMYIVAFWKKGDIPGTGKIRPWFIKWVIGKIWPRFIRGGIWKIWPWDKPHPPLNPATPLKPEDIAKEDIYKPERMSFRDWRVIRFGVWFSILSAFNIGWRDLNVGSWLSRIQPHAYNMQPSGWVRFVSGLQSLISVYLVAIWALTYFGRPFG